MPAVLSPGRAARAPGSERLPLALVLAELEPLAMSSSGYVFAVAFGLLWGSFANVCIYRWPAGRSVVAPGSHCTACQAPIRWYDNVPVLSWLWLRGRCRACQAVFSPRYLVVEATTGALFGVAWWAAVVAPAMFEPFGARLLHAAIYAAFCFAMVVISFIDLDHKLILHKVTVPSIALAYAASFAWPERRWYDGVVGAAVGYGLPWAIGEIYYRITRREGLGLGDGMLLAVIGALLGWRGVVVSLFGGSMIGSVIGITAVLVARAGGPEVDAPDAAPADTAPADTAPADPHKPDADQAQAEKPSVMRTELPFGPFLAMAAVVYLFAEPWIEIHFQLPGG
jgi:leader peptidase (prepilin peptidase)/N-methyltransferase